MSKTKGQKFKTAALTILFIAVVFFGTYGVSRVQLSLLGKENIYGYVEANEWDERMTFDADAYFSLTVNEGGTLKVLMLTDTHFKNGGWYANYFWVGEAVNRGAYADIKKLVKDAAPDFIYLTGDIETASLNDLIFEEFGAFMDGFKIPWTMTMGNHDAENRADKAKVAEILLAAEYCVLDVGFTNLNGLGNTVIPVKDGNGRILYAFILMDFGDWQLRKDANKQYSTYDAGVTKNQIGWYEWVVTGLKTEAGKNIETMLLAHIPFHAAAYAAKLTYAGSVLGYADKLISPEDKYLYGTDPFDVESEFGYETAEYKAFREAYKAEGNKGYEILTLSSYYEYAQNDEFFEVIKSLDSTKQIVSGHNHCDGYSVIFDGITYTSVVKTGDIYVHNDWDNGNRGGTLFSFENKDGTIAVSSKRLFV